MYCHDIPPEEEAGKYRFFSLLIRVFFDAYDVTTLSVALLCPHLIFFVTMWSIIIIFFHFCNVAQRIFFSFLGIKPHNKWHVVSVWVAGCSINGAVGLQIQFLGILYLSSQDSWNQRSVAKSINAALIHTRVCMLCVCVCGCSICHRLFGPAAACRSPKRKKINNSHRKKKGFGKLTGSPIAPE